MDWFAQIDGYCERLHASYWAEPVNAVTNLSFIIAAAIMWPRSAGLPIARALCLILFAIGVGSYLFHTHATAWAALADVAPIGLFILTYLFAINRDAVLMRTSWAFLATLLFFPYAALMVPVLNQIPFLQISNFYWTVPVLLVVYAVFLRHQAELARGFLAGAAILTASITFRSLDARLCDALPIGTHFLWHVLNGVMLGWMIEVYRRHMLAGRTA
ncbi:ceramidase domain-containing protein [Yoonia sp.]|uniref:ceramidase domain-containing protein n=1 Tax=Yoonia sp. TaxID=2212373 RepID=UPI003F6D4CBE